MGVLIHPNYSDEQANGVAITKNIYNPRWQGVYINAQIETVYEHPVSTEHVLTNHELEELRENLQLIHSHFKRKYNGDEDFAMDVEFKITETTDGSRGRLAIKQARPWTD